MSKTLLAKGPSEESADSAATPPTGLLRGFTGALSALARSLARAEAPGAPEANPIPSDPAATTTVEPPHSSEPTWPFPPGYQPSASHKPIEGVANPYTNIRSDLLTLLSELDGELDGDAPALNAAALPAPPPLPPPAVKLVERNGHESLRTDMLAETAPPSLDDATDSAPRDAPTSSTSYAILSGKTIGVIGFDDARGIELGQALAAQRCSFVTFSHADAEFRKGSTNGCDVLLIEARPEWTTLGSGEVSSLLTSKKPIVVLGDAMHLLTAAVIAQGGPREFVPAPATTDELLWRTALLVSRIPGPKTRGRKRNRVAQVIIGDDDPSSRTLVHAMLAQEGMKCHAADNGAQVLALARARSADVIVVDVNMPGLDGFQVLAEIKRDPALAGARVILLTARQAEADVLRGFGLGADDYVTKPFSPLELAARVKRLLARSA